MQYNIINVKKIFILLYVIIPSFFYLLFCFYTLIFGNIRVYFFYSTTLTITDLFSYFMIHFLIGIILIYILKKTNFEIIYRYIHNIFYDIFIFALYAFIIFLHVPYLNDIIAITFIILLASYRPSNFSFFLLYLIAFVQIVYFQDRFPIIMISIIFFLPYISKLTYKRLFLLLLIGIFFMVYILQPLKGGSLPFTNSYFDLFYIVKHMYPILIGANASANLSNISELQIFAESVPLFKGILNYNSVVEIIAEQTLSNEALMNGTRLGSNSTLFLNGYGIFVLAILFAFMFLLINIFKNKIFYNATLIFFIAYGPYFIRRFFGSYILDFLLMSIIAFSMYLLIINSSKNKINIRSK